MNNEDLTQTDTATDIETAGAPETASEDVAQIQNDLNELQTELNAARDRHLRLAAEFDNYRKRVAREQNDSVVRAQASLLQKLLEVLDDLERFTEHLESAPKDSLLHGVELIEQKLRRALETSGLERIDAENALFDPNSMEAIMTVPAETPEEDDHVADVFQSGYRYQGVLLRPARVRVKKYED
jgi:molecular chaperone GrpE